LIIKSKIKYKAQPGIHDEHSPIAIVPILIKYFHPLSVVDVGCGPAYFLKVFKKMGVKTMKGIDGKWCDKNLLFQNIDEIEFQEMDLEKLVILPQRYDMALCLEVAEHLQPASAENFIKVLTTYSDVIVFSAAIPDQGGFNHLNEQWPSYWEKIFNKFQFQKCDILRPIIWNDTSIKFWYRQNMVVYINQNSDLILEDKMNTEFYKERLIHPDLYRYKSLYLDRILEGRYTFKGYIKMLLKFFRNKFS